MIEEDCEIRYDLLNDAVKFHGHLGPFLVLGLKAGLFANKVLGKDYFRMRAIVETKPNPPYSCFMDGIQVATGCTMGKGNIIAKNGESISVTFIKDGKILKMRLKESILEDFKAMSSEGDSERKALETMRRSVSELFDISIEEQKG
ncbi:MAG: formylmethanofuran dehydrogenase subunit E family protein [Candidatus Bathyarchaeia archaeon]